ncbi:MAG TPA: ABC transporter ATP-binding protein [Firmicutes bacterium]|nr:ABC transporter ATP-binding protein [Candidatus Fermentithermobacillaceae bacterium]
MLKIDKLNVYYGGIHALDDVSVEVNTGEIVTIIGANGAGKSTLLRTISGLVRATSGKVSFESRDIKRMSPHQVVESGIVHAPEGRRVFSELTVDQNLRLGAYLRKDREQMDEDLARVFQLFPRLEERRWQIAGTLSGGEQQMLCIGRALMSRPKLLLLDEPSMGLAPVLVQEIYREIEEIRKHTTILLVEQNAYQALKTADRGYVLETGRIVMEAPCRELLRNPEVKKAYLGK